MTEPYRPRRAPQAGTRELRGLRHHVTVWPGEGAPIVLLHGFMDCGATFQFLVDEFATARPLIAPDWRGFGRSAWAPGGYWFPDYFADLEALLDEFAPGETVDVVGHSMGGNIALTYAGLRPGRVRRLMTLEGFGLHGVAPELAPARYRDWLEQLRRPEPASVFPDFDVLAGVLCRRNPRLTAERAAFVARAWAEALPDGRARLRFDPAHKRVNPILYRREEAEACWREIVAPVACLAGAASEFVARLRGVGDAASLQRHVPRLESHVVADAGHMLHHDQPAQVARIIDEFLGRDTL
ncbi:MAG TPA: alpha/beta hydrolase [Steroidobacteraceae bacterium]|nr:alpha/beta hydrolase [Steroidobacteraceae bacterium]